MTLFCLQPLDFSLWYAAKVLRRVPLASSQLMSFFLRVVQILNVFIWLFLFHYPLRLTCCGDLILFTRLQTWLIWLFAYMDNNNNTTTYTLSEFKTRNHLEHVQAGIHTRFNVGCLVALWVENLRQWNLHTPFELYWQIFNTDTETVFMDRTPETGLLNRLFIIQFHWFPTSEWVSAKSGG